MLDMCAWFLPLSFTEVVSHMWFESRLINRKKMFKGTAGLRAFTSTEFEILKVD